MSRNLPSGIPFRGVYPLLLLITASSLVGPAAADQVTISPMKDNTLFEDLSGLVSDGSGPTFFVGQTDVDETRRGLLKFDIAGNVPAMAAINSVTLRLNCSRVNRNGTPTVAISLHRVSQDWGEGTSDAGINGGGGAAAAPNDATWLHTFFNTATWTTPGGDYAVTASAALLVAGTGMYTWASTPQLVADVQGWLDTPATNFGWLVKAPETTVGSAKRFDTRENPTVGNRPMLTIDYTPFNTPTIRSSWGAIKALYR